MKEELEHNHVWLCFGKQYILKNKLSRAENIETEKNYEVFLKYAGSDMIAELNMEK